MAAPCQRLPDYSMYLNQQETVYRTRPKMDLLRSQASARTAVFDKRPEELVEGSDESTNTVDESFSVSRQIAGTQSVNALEASSSESNVSSPVKVSSGLKVELLSCL